MTSTNAAPLAVEPCRILRFAAGAAVIALAAVLLAFLFRYFGWPNRFLWTVCWNALGFVAWSAGMAGWVAWGNLRRVRSDGALFGRHSRIGTSAENDAYSITLLAATITLAVAQGVVQEKIFPYLSPLLVLVILFGIGRPNSPRDLGMMLVRSFIAIMGIVAAGASGLFFSLAWSPGYPVWSGLLGLVSLAIGGILLVYVANAHADESWRHEHGEPDAPPL